MKLGFLMTKTLDVPYRPYRHKNRTLFFITQGRWQSKTLILSTNADQKSIKQGFLLSFVAQLAMAANPVCLISILHELCALPDVVSFSNYE